MSQAALTRRLRFVKRFKKSEDGATAVEFALVGMPFFWLLMAIFETGLMLFTEYVIENGTADASRLIRTGQVFEQGMSKADFKAEVCGGLAGFLDCNTRLHVDVRSYTDFESVSSTTAVDGDGELTPEVTSASSYSPGGELDVVVVRVYYDWKLFTPGISQLANLANGRRVLSSSAAFRNEPFGS
ncbi:MAG: TadE/TadG family type IV pilus assembly protein [Aestuariivirgaceae bacterium]